MPYRPLNHNEYAIVQRTLYDVRGLNEGFAESLFMAYKAKALHDDVPEFDIFTSSEHERLASKGIDTEKFKGLVGTDFFIALDNAIADSDGKSEKIPKNTFTWLFGDESPLDAKHKRLRVLFFNSARYRKQALRYYVEENIIQDTDDISHIRNQLESFAKKYPGLRQGVISNYELYFGDPSQFSYEQVKRRKTFLTDQEARNLFLTFYNLPVNWSITDIKDYLRKVGLESGSLSPDQVEQWNNKEFALEL